MGYVVPPPPGGIIYLDHGMKYIEVTSLSDDGPRFVEAGGISRQRAIDDYVERLRQAQHIVRMEEWHKETIRQANIGATLLLALVVCIGYGIAQLLGLA